MKHILRYGTHADKQFINQKNYYYDTMLFNGNMIAYTPKAICKFINSNLLSKSYFIDPQTNAFQYSLKFIKAIGKNETIPTLKKSYKNLLNCYGEKISDIVTNKDRELEILDFTNDLINEFSKKVLDFQYNKIFDYSEKENFTEFLSDEEKSKLRPEYLIIPYFSIDNNNLEWLNINKKLIEKSSQLYEGNYTDSKLSAQLVIDLNVLDENIDAIIKNYNDNQITNVMLWVDDFNESNRSNTELLLFSNIIKKFYDNNINVINLYGGYFSIILGHFKNDLEFELNGVSHGLEYGEYRKFAPVGGGIPKAKYYYYDIHQRVEPQDMIDIFRYRKIVTAMDYFQNICNCKICKNVMIDKVEFDFYIFLNTEFYTVKGQKGRRTYPSRITREVSLLHYLENKDKEFKALEKIKSINILLNILQTQIDIHTDNFSSDIQHLQTWISTLNDLRIP